jgi:hypothetical protein
VGVSHSAILQSPSGRLPLLDPVSDPPCSDLSSELDTFVTHVFSNVPSILQVTLGMLSAVVCWHEISHHSGMLFVVLSPSPPSVSYCVGGNFSD